MMKSLIASNLSLLLAVAGIAVGWLADIVFLRCVLLTALILLCLFKERIKGD